MSLGVTVGKFYPFHLGHDHLIASAKQRVDRLVVLVGEKPEDTLPGRLRADWIGELHPDVEVLVTPDDLPEAPEPWAERALELLGQAPDVAFTSEEYGAPWAAALGARHEAVDLDRARFPISGTQLRADLAQHWVFLTAPAKAWFARRVVVVGAESSGKTTLAQGLAAHYRTTWVPEYGRHYWEGRRHLDDRAWGSDEFDRIARGQVAWEDDLARRAERLLICDTDPLVTEVWHRRYRGEPRAALRALVGARRRDLYLLTAPDFPHVQDGTRESAAFRDDMHAGCLALLEAGAAPFMTLTGPPEQRLAQAIARIDPLLTFPALATP